MTNEERQLLLSLADTVIELKRSRDDMAIGVAAAILDLHRLLRQVTRPSMTFSAALPCRRKRSRMQVPTKPA